MIGKFQSERDVARAARWRRWEKFGRTRDRRGQVSGNHVLVDQPSGRTSVVRVVARLLSVRDQDQDVVLLRRVDRDLTVLPEPIIGIQVRSLADLVTAGTVRVLPSGFARRTRPDGETK